MSYTFLQEQGEESSAESFLDIEQCAPSRLKSIPERFYSKDRETESCHGSRYGMILQRLTEDHGKVELISFPGGFRVKTFQQQEKGLESMVSGQDSGEKWPGWFARYLPDLSLWKTPQCSLLEDYIEFSETWPKWGTMQDGVCWELMTPERHIEGSESGYWPTPTKDQAGVMELKTKDGEPAKPGQRAYNPKTGKHTHVTLNRAVAMWPTPAKRDYKGANSREHCEVNGTGRMHMDQLPNAVAHGGTATRQTYPTPCSRDHKNATAKEWDNKGRTRNLNRYMAKQGENSEKTHERLGQLNPSWVEWLMGWPIEWTDLKPLGMDKFQQWRRSHLLFYRKESLDATGQTDVR